MTSSWGYRCLFLQWQMTIHIQISGGAQSLFSETLKFDKWISLHLCHSSHEVSYHRHIDRLSNSFSSWERRQLKERNMKKKPIKTTRCFAICEGNPPITCGLVSQRINDAEIGSRPWRLRAIRFTRSILYIRGFNTHILCSTVFQSTKTILAIHSAMLRVWYSMSFAYLIRPGTGSRSW